MAIEKYINVNNAESNMPSNEHMQTEFQVDETDKAILNALLKDSRLSYREIGKKIGKSPVTVMKRLHAMKKGRVIRRHTVDIDYDRIGFDVSVIIELRISKGKLIQVEKKIATHPNVVALYDNTGDFDATIIGRFRNRRAMDAFLKMIQTYDFVERTRTKLILNTIKEEGNRV